MAVADARVPNTQAQIPISILAMALRIETAFTSPRLQALSAEFETLREDLQSIRTELRMLQTNVERCLEDVETLRQDVTPIWNDDYNLCGDPTCEGDCRVCQEGEYDGEEEYVEKYCRRGRR